jgi:hypothetical protein
MTEGWWYEVSYAQFARLFDFRRKDSSHPKLHMSLKLDSKQIMFMYPRNKIGSSGTTIDLLPLYAYLNRLFRRTMTPREGDGSKIPSYNKNILIEGLYNSYIRNWPHSGATPTRRGRGERIIRKREASSSIEGWSRGNLEGVSNWRAMS